MKIDYAVQCPDKSHCIRVGLRLQAGVDSVNGKPLTSDEIHEVPVRKSLYESLTVAKKLAYVQECEKWHHKRDAAVRAKWDADDKVKMEAAAAAAKAAEEARFIVTPHGIKESMVSVTVVHHGLTFSGNVAKGADKTEFEANCRAAFTEFETRVNAEKTELAALAINA